MVIVSLSLYLKPVTYKGHDPNAQPFVTIGERIHCISPAIRKAMDSYDEAPILKRAAEQIAAGAAYLDVNIGLGIETMIVSLCMKIMSEIGRASCRERV